MIDSSIIVLIALIAFSVIDLKWKAIPSVLLTTTLFLVAVVNPQNFYFAILCGLFAVLLYEFGFIGGIADIKATIIIGFIFTNYYEVFAFMILFVLLGTIYKIMAKVILSKYKEIEVAFLPVYLITYILLKVIIIYGFGGIL